MRRRRRTGTYAHDGSASRDDRRTHSSTERGGFGNRHDDARAI